jgi:hypothetical protein
VVSSRNSCGMRNADCMAVAILKMRVFIVGMGFS